MMRLVAHNLAVTPAMLQAGVSRSTLGTGFNRKLVGAINAAYADVFARGAVYRQWFGGMAARRDLILPSMTRLRDFANGVATVTMVIKPRLPDGSVPQAYVWGQGQRSTIGQYILNLGDDFGGISDGARAVLKYRTAEGECIRTVAHELSHLVFGANQNPPTPGGYTTEHYRDNAAELADVDPVYAAYNADNYGYFIENCTP